MTNHPHRSRAPSVGRSPSPHAIRAAREACGLSAASAAQTVCTTGRTWQRWEAGEVPMHPGLWELFRSKMGLDESGK